MFWRQESQELKDRYIEYLKIIGSLSRLYTDSKVPYLYYRAHENLFCHVFGAKNLSRGDISFDATKNDIGIGLKTFLNSNGQTFQKVAEFNADSKTIRSLPTEKDIVHKIAELRNKRLKTTQNATNTKKDIYHMVTREVGNMMIHEEPMNEIDIPSIKIDTTQSLNTIRFTDKYSDYSFSLSKNTLLKRFDTRSVNTLQQFNIEILDNPFEALKSLQVDESGIGNKGVEERIILPLYSPHLGKVPLKSGLNQWNASGRPRHINEVYIHIPSWIHDKFNDFFEYGRKFKGKSAKNSPSFTVELPNGCQMSCKIAQAGGKALMSNPNKVLGKWLLRDVLKIKEGELLTLEMLNEIGIDSVKLTKRSNDYYILDFMESGSFEEFQSNNL